MIRSPAFFVTLALFLILFLNGFSLAQRQRPNGERIVMCMIQLEHADAEGLASVLEPLLSPAGSIVPYRPTNMLIIRDRVSVVEQLSMAIKGKPCTPMSHSSDAEEGNVREESHLDK